VVAAARREEILPPALAAVVARGELCGLATLPVELARRVRMLPTATVTGEGLLLAVCPDRVFVDAGRGERATELLLAFAPLKGNTDECEALLPPEALG
jgi:hypothetical protein